jgi:hypothetical protein
MLPADAATTNVFNITVSIHPPDRSSHRVERCDAVRRVTRPRTGHPPSLNDER